MSTLEVRTVPATIEKINVDGRMPSISGYAATYNTLSQDLGGFREIIRPGSIQPHTDVRALLGHERANLLGRTKSGTLKLNLDEKGVGFSLELPNTTLGRDVAEMLQRGDYDSMSFGFKTTKDVWSTSSEGTIRELHGIDLREISIVAEPAYSGTSVSVRALERAVQISKEHISVENLETRLKLSRYLYITM